MLVVGGLSAAPPAVAHRRLSSRSASAAPARLAAQPRRSTPTFKRSAPSCAASVGATRFVTGAGRVGSATFTPPPPAKKSSSKFLIVFTLFGIVLPTVGAIAVALCSPVCTALGDVLHSLLLTRRIATQALASGPLQLSSAALKFPALATVVNLAVYFWVTLQVSGARHRYGVRPPATVGVSEDFDRYLRVQANTIEGLILFLPALWLSALLVRTRARACRSALLTPAPGEQRRLRLRRPSVRRRSRDVRPRLLRGRGQALAWVRHHHTVSALCSLARSASALTHSLPRSVHVHLLVLSSIGVARSFLAL